MHPYELGKKYARATQEADLARTVGSLNGGTTYKDYLANNMVRKEVEEAILEFNFLKKSIFNFGRYVSKKDVPKWKEKGDQRQKEFEKMVLPVLYLAIDNWFCTIASPCFSESRENQEGKYGGYIKDWQMGLTAEGILEARLDFRVDDEVAAENDFLAIFAQLGFKRVVPKDCLDQSKKGLYYFNKEIVVEKE